MIITARIEGADLSTYAYRLIKRKAGEGEWVFAICDEYTENGIGKNVHEACIDLFDSLCADYEAYAKTTEKMTADAQDFAAQLRKLFE